ncbi:MAG TPA: hypothetical protein VNZ66_10705 [Aeromicrobium sp.]|nr:hypothetical protein [Aeromicrobium sp.]
MGMFDWVLGRTRPPAADLDALFAVPQAAVTLQLQGFTPTGQGAVCYRSGEGAAFAAAETQAEQLVATDGSTVARTDDSYGFRWLSVTRPTPDVSGLVTDVHAVNTSLRDAGFDQALLCSTVGFTTPAAGPMALVYAYKRGTFYPFVPIGPSKRDNATELQIRGLVAEDLAVEPELANWFAIWGAPGL